MKRDQIAKINALLTQAMSASSGMTTNAGMNEVRNHMRAALQKLESLQKRDQKRTSANQTQYDEWWGHVQTVAKQPVARSTHESWLKTLDKMLSDEQAKLDALEKAGEKKQVVEDEFLID